MRARRGSGRRLAGRVGALVAAGALTAFGTATAQEPTAPTASPSEWRRIDPPGAERGTFWFRMSGPEASPRARLGVFLRAGCPDDGPAEECEAPPVVASVVPGGPADRAGVRAGERLISLDGVALATPQGRAALGELREGVEVRLVVGGADGARRTLRLTPEVRAPTAGAFLERSSPSGTVERAEVRVIRLPSPEGMEQLEVHLDSLRGSGSSVVVVRPDASGALRIEVAGDELATALTAADARGRAPAAAPERGEEVEPAPAPAVGYVVESPELARSLARARETALRSARVRLDSLVRLRKEMPGPVVLTPAPRPGGPPTAGRDGENVRATWTLKSADPEVEVLLATNARIAGAEFRPLTAELAEYFRGAESGLLVLRVIPGTPAGRLGLRGGDVVFEAAGRAVDSVDELRAALEDGRNSPVEVKWIRKGVVEEGRIELP